MAQVFSLIAWGGRTGKTVSLSASTDVVTLTNHGLRNGTKLWPSGTLPAELNTSTPVYARSTAANTFTLHTSSAGAIANTGQITFAGSSTYAAVVLKSDLVADPANSLAPYGLSDLSRWGASGSERIYDGLSNWNSGRAGASAFDSEVAEIGEAFSDINSVDMTILFPSGSIKVETKINGIRSAGYHFGVIKAGYIYHRLDQNSSNPSIGMGKYGTVIDGITLLKGGTSYSNGGVAVSGNSELKNSILIGSFNNSGIGIYGTGQFCRVSRCLAIGWNVGFYTSQYVYGLLVSSCTFTKNNTGIGVQGATNIFGSYYNNISVGNTSVNWSTAAPFEAASNNAGLTGQAWITGANPRITIATTDFVDFSGTGTAPNWTVLPDYHPALSTSPQVDAGAWFYGASLYDISDAESPSYNNGGAEAYDIGAYEFDHGYGPHPASTSVTFQGVVAGSEIRVFNSSGVEIAGIESCGSNQVLTWTIPDPATVQIKIINFSYRIMDFPYTSVVGNQTIPVQMEADRWAYNP